MFLVSSSTIVSIFHSTWLDTFWTALIYYNKHPTNALDLEKGLKFAVDVGTEGGAGCYCSIIEEGFLIPGMGGYGS